jgi:hypothetical protein
MTVFTDKVCLLLHPSHSLPQKIDAQELRLELYELLWKVYDDYRLEYTIYKRGYFHHGAP